MASPLRLVMLGMLLLSRATSITAATGDNTCSGTISYFLSAVIRPRGPVTSYLNDTCTPAPASCPTAGDFVQCNSRTKLVENTPTVDYTCYCGSTVDSDTPVAATGFALQRIHANVTGQVLNYTTPDDPTGSRTRTFTALPLPATTLSRILQQNRYACGCFPDDGLALAGDPPTYDMCLACG